MIVPAPSLWSIRRFASITAVFAAFSIARAEEAAPARTVLKAEDPALEYFPTADDAVNTLKQRLEATKGMKFSAIRGALNKNTDTTSEEVAAFDTKMEEYFKHSGPLVRVDVHNLPQLGETFRRVGYFLLYEHNLIFIDIWFYRKAKGWVPFDSEITVNSQPADVLKEIPDVFFN